MDPTRCFAEAAYFAEWCPPLLSASPPRSLIDPGYAKKGNSLSFRVAQSELLPASFLSGRFTTPHIPPIHFSNVESFFHFPPTAGSPPQSVVKSSHFSCRAYLIS